MQETVADSSVVTAARVGERLRGYFTASIVGGIAVAAFGFLFNRATVLSYSIGYNLYGAERLLAGEVPYRDFYTLYPPATLYFNGFLFKWLGVSLYSAMFGVFIFKVLTILALYFCGRRVLPRGWSVAVALISLFWLRPNGAFKAVPMQYGALFLALALYLLLAHEKIRKAGLVFGAGVALGLLTLFKHNIGGYSLIGCLAYFIVANRTLGLKQDRGALRPALISVAGFASVVLPVALYMLARGAFGSMTSALLLGPGEFLATRLVFPRSPVVPIMFLLILSACIFGAYKIKRLRKPGILIWALLLAGVSALSIGADQFAVNKLIFYLPLVIFATSLLGFVANKRVAVERRREILLTLVFAVAAFVELFPRFAREQSIGAMPFVVLLLLLVIYVSRHSIRAFTGGQWQSRLAIGVLTVPFLLIGARLLFSVYFDNDLRFISDTELRAERGRGVFFPEATARHVDEVVAYIQTRVAPDGYIFAQSNAGSPYLFLAARKNPSTAQFWGGVGVTPREREATLEEIDRRKVSLIITTDEVVAAEQYAPLKDYIERNFTTSTRFDDVLILERQEHPTNPGQ